MRKVVLANHEIYHIYNRAIDGRPVLSDRSSKTRFTSLLWFYRYIYRTMSYSNFQRLSQPNLESALQILLPRPKRVHILAYCLMDNHFHLLIDQLADKGISGFKGDVLNGFTRYSNLKNERAGAIFLNQFKAVRMESDEQLQHVFRYIMLNPYTGFMVKTIPEIFTYQWSSIGEHIGNASTRKICNDERIMDQFTSIEAMHTFIEDQADYQRTLGEIKHLLHELP